MAAILSRADLMPCGNAAGCAYPSSHIAAAPPARRCSEPQPACRDGAYVLSLVTEAARHGIDITSLLAIAARLH